MRFEGRRVVGGRAEGAVLAAEKPLSLLGGVDAATGAILDPESPIRGERVGGRILAVPHGKGSTVGSYVLYALRKRGVAPSAILAARAETILAVGAVISDVPMVDRVPVDLLRTGDRVAVDADAGVADAPDLVEKHVVTAFLEREGRVLVVRRSEKVGSFRGKWSGVSGFLEGPDPEAHARREVEEETGITDLRTVARGPIVRSRGADTTVYSIHPFRFEAPRGEVRLDWENVEYRWLPPNELEGLDGVPRLAAAYRATFTR
jgi:predicted aconitase with swiveling domain/8-oxo-dGTP pyrophosphatase MutT (NUDIX family)